MSQSLFTGTDGPGGLMRGLIRFAMPATLQAKVTVTHVALNMTIQNPGTTALPSPALATITATEFLQRVTVSWVQGNVSSGNSPGDGSGTTVGSFVVGQACATGATWNQASCGVTNWTAGAPISGTSASVSTAGKLSGATVTWDSSSNSTMITDVQSWIDNANSNNFGWRISSNTEGTGAQAQRFGTKESSAPPNLVVDYDLCIPTAKTACKHGTGGNVCVSPPGASTQYQCSCGAGYQAGGTATNPTCVDIPSCNGSPNPCATNNTTATCADQAPPASSYVCTCAAGWSAPGSGGTCTSSCTCGVTGSTCTSIATGGWTCTSCPTGYQSNGTSTPTCVNIDGCASAGNNCLQNIGGAGNSCADVPAPGTGYTCNCGAGYDGQGTTSCVAHNDCLNGGDNNPCNDQGDATGACTDSAPPSTGHTCTCDAAGGYSSNGVTCVKACDITPPGLSNPCGDTAGTCTPTGATTWMCTCGSGYRSSSGSQPTCVNFNACSGSGAVGNTNCETVNGNQCTDLAPTSESYTCICGLAYTGTGTTSCLNKNECAPNPCDDGGDVGVSMACQDIAAPSTGYSCTCDTGFAPSNGTCQSACGNAVLSGPNPCGAGTGTCAVVGSGGWSCTCNAGYVSVGTTTPTCTNLDACDAQAIVNCTSFSSNGCVDQSPPSLTYQCTCGNAAFVNGTGVNGKPACVDKDECTPNNCRTSGDDFAVCTDHVAPLVGYDCACASPTLWSVAVVGGFTTCVDTNECAAAINPCLHGVCANIALGGGYACTCDPGYVLNGPTITPTCVHPDGCGVNSAITCVTTQLDNQCIDDAPPKIGYSCDCGNPAYTKSIDGRSCVDKNDCAVNHCIDAGNGRAECVDRKAPKAGYDCECGVGWESDGATCIDINECVGGANPCGKGTCTNTKGSYQCTCPSGFASKSSPTPTCVASGSSGYINYTIESGGCSLGAESDPINSLPPLLLSLVFLIIARRRSTNSACPDHRVI